MKSSNRRGTLAFVLAAPLALLGAGSAFAGSDDRDATADEMARVKSALEAKGYTDVHDIEVDDGRFEADARNAQGQKVDLELDLKSLEVLYEDRD